jgi:hypothetical protein
MKWVTQETTLVQWRTNFLWTTKVLSDIVRFAAAVVILSSFTPLPIYMQKNFIFLQ